MPLNRLEIFAVFQNAFHETTRAYDAHLHTIEHGEDPTTSAYNAGRQASEQGEDPLLAQLTSAMDQVLGGFDTDQRRFLVGSVAAFMATIAANNDAP